MPDGVFLVICKRLLLIQHIPKPSEILSLREMISCATVQRDWELCQVLQGYQWWVVLPVSPLVFLSAIVETLELLLHHHLLKVEDTLQRGASGEVRHVMLKLIFVKGGCVVICDLSDAPVAKIWSNRVEERLELVVFVFAGEHFEDLHLFQSFLDDLIVFHFLEDPRGAGVNSGDWGQCDKQVHVLTEKLHVF